MGHCCGALHYESVHATYGGLVFPLRAVLTIAVQRKARATCTFMIVNALGSVEAEFRQNVIAPHPKDFVGLDSTTAHTPTTKDLYLAGDM